MLLPPKDFYNVNFLRAVLCGEKKLIAREHVVDTKVPRYEEFAVKTLLQQFRGVPEVNIHLPEDHQLSRDMPREFFFLIVGTVWKDWLKAQVKHAHETRCGDTTRQNDSKIHVTPEMLAMLQDGAFRSGKDTGSNLRTKGADGLPTQRRRETCEGEGDGTEESATGASGTGSRQSTT